jgi:hypothetical protein
LKLWTRFKRSTIGSNDKSSVNTTMNLLIHKSREFIGQPNNFNDFEREVMCCAVNYLSVLRLLL